MKSGRASSRSLQTIYEWDTISRSTFKNQCAFEELHEWALGPEGAKVLEAGSGTLKARNAAGVVMTRSGHVLEILPKTEVSTSVEDARRILLGMLITSRTIPTLRSGRAPAAVARLPLSDAMVELFFEATVELAKRGLATEYATKEEAPPALRGRIRFGAWAARGALSKSIPCDFDELTGNTKANRALATGIASCLEAGLGRRDARKLGLLNDAFSEVTPFDSPESALQALRSTELDRKHRDYRDALELCGLILGGLEPSGTWDLPVRFGLFFPMEKVFERFVYARLVELLRQGEINMVRYQSNPYFLVSSGSDQEERRSFNLRPDLLVRTVDGTIWIVDAKWKLLDSMAIDGKRGVSQSDLYQLLSYAMVYRSEAQHVDRLMLVYPAWSGFDEVAEYSFRDSSRIPLRLSPFRLDGQQDSAIFSGS